MILLTLFSAISILVAIGVCTHLILDWQREINRHIGTLTYYVAMSKSERLRIVDQRMREEADSRL